MESSRHREAEISAFMGIPVFRCEDDLLHTVEAQNGLPTLKFDREVV